MKLSNDMSERKQQLASMLSNAVHEVTFTKVDGDIRIMPCTLDPILLPVAVIKEDTLPKKVRTPNPELLSVWCTDKKEWRSFKVMNVTSISEATSV